MTSYKDVPVIDPIVGGPGPEEADEARHMWRDLEAAVYQLEMSALGLAFSRAGLVWFPPLCHDGYDY